ncbi:MAG: acetate--CoA ligase family protein [Candidatus Omnitrophica bacterium]|nr:acetate--CoA ligase family protein [Candidatus Omnitrophota bacterium]
MLNYFFNPESVCLIGASTNPEKLGFKILKNIIDGGYKGKIFPVNPKAEQILNLKCYKNVSEIPYFIELAIVAIPSDFVCEVVEELGKKCVKGVIIISAGFKETGEEGKKKEEKLKEIIKKYNMRVIGPNCLGVIDTKNKLNASFAFEMPQSGKISFITQSGALGTAILDWSMKENVGFSKFVSFGNKVDVSEIDLIEELENDPDTNVILLYLESITDGRKFIDLTKRVIQKKPIILIKSGKTESGSKSAISHTGSLSGSDIAFNAAIKKSGIIRANTVEELFDYALIFSYQPVLKGNRICVITNAGGPSVMTVDMIEEKGLNLAKFSLQTIENLKSFLPPASNINNPIDVLGDAKADRYEKVIEEVIFDDNVDGIIVILTPQITTQIRETAEIIARISKKCEKSVVACFMGGKRVEEGINILKQNKIPNYFSPERCVISLKAMDDYRKFKEKVIKGKYIEFKVEKEKVREKIENFKNQKISIIGDIEGREILSFYGINTITSFLAKNQEECEKFLEENKGVFVMKVVSPDIIHKTEAGGIKLGIRTAKQAKQAFEEIINSSIKYKPDARIIGVQIQEMVEKGVEVIIGVNKDIQFGHLIMFGLGGIYVELLKDVSFRIAPLTDIDVDEMINEIKTLRILKGFRNMPACDIDAIKETILRVSQLVCDFPEIKEMDINPIIVKEKDSIVVDVRFVFDF